MGRLPGVIIAAILAICIAEPAPAATRTVSLVGAWQVCDPNGCSLRYAFMPNGRVIKQYVLRDVTVTARGRYHQRGNGLQIVWTRFSPRRVCGPPSAAGGQQPSDCAPTAEPNVEGPLQFEGFNTLVWTIPSAPLRLVRIEQ
ncbi:hypothetical protein SAMN05444161_8756 [Rhizobiales bacterium GAS191]|nr:hypothetical protein SAMN05444161_8756 [Rhizobiales bacterium GAS191]